MASVALKGGGSPTLKGLMMFTWNGIVQNTEKEG